MNIKRNLDVIYRNADLEHLYTFSKFPVFMGCTAADSCDDLREDMSFWVSRQSGMIQLNPLLPLDINYPEAHGAGLVGKLWAQHHQAFAEYIGKFSPSSVLEIGGAHGILANNYQSIKSIPWIIVEPNPTPVKDCKAKIIKGFFDEKFKISEDVDAVIHSHEFEHIYDPMKFMSHLREFMGTGKKLIFSVPNMRVMMSRKYTNCLNFEHTIFLTEEYIEYLLSSNGFRILEHCYFSDDHSIFFAAVREENVKVVLIPEFLYEKNKSMFLAYISEHQQLINNINKEISGLSNVFLFGAHAQAQYLIGFGLNIKDIDAILDNDKNKHGKRLYGTNKIVLDPAMLVEIKTPTVIVRAGTFTSEIVEQILSINPNTNILL